MALQLMNLDRVTRALMLEELERDVESGSLYLSPRLKPNYRGRYLELLREATRDHDDSWLAERIAAEGLLNTHEERRTKSGVTLAKVPVTAPETLAEGEFNRLYLRALSTRAISEGLGGLEIYRAKAVVRPRPESEVMIGRVVDPEQLLRDIRMHPGVDTALGLPPGPNSGLSARFRS